MCVYKIFTDCVKACELVCSFLTCDFHNVPYS